jgi:type VI secretion system protein ImpL
MGARDPYQIPRILVTGAPAAVDALCRAWRLTSVGAPTWFGRVWHDAEGVLLAEPGDALALPSADRQLKAWRRILRALLRNRAGRPLDAILWVIPVETLTADDGQPRDMSAASLKSSRKISALQRQFGLMLPIYIVISGCDALPGFEDLADRLQGTSNSTPLGWASPYPVKQAYDPAWIDAAFGSMRAALAGTITELGTLDGAMGEALFLLPQRIDSLRVPFGERVDLALRGAAVSAPAFAGVRRASVAGRAACRTGAGVTHATRARAAHALASFRDRGGRDARHHLVRRHGGVVVAHAARRSDARRGI